MPILTLPSTTSVLDSNLVRPTHIITDELLRGVWPWSLPQQFINFESIAQTFFFVQNCTFRMQLDDMNVEGGSYK